MKLLPILATMLALALAGAAARLGAGGAADRVAGIAEAMVDGLAP